ncbi:MAG: hypothetical protein ACI9BO_001153 [Zhongshania sp.]|jgi:hypothetical protein
MKKTLFIAFFCTLSLQAHAGFWDSVSSFFGSDGNSQEQATASSSAEANMQQQASMDQQASANAEATKSAAANMELNAKTNVEASTAGLNLNANTNVSSSAAGSSMAQTGLQLLPLLSQSLGVTGAQATGGMGALLQAAQLLLSGTDFGVLAKAIPGAETMLSAAPAVMAAANGGGIMNSAMKMVGDQNPQVKAGAQLLGQFKSLGMGAEMIPKFSDVGSNYLKQNGNAEASVLLNTAISAAM